MLITFDKCPYIFIILSYFKYKERDIIQLESIIYKYQLCMDRLSKEQIKQIIETYKFKSSQEFNNSEVCLNYLISYIQNMTVSNDALWLAKKLIQHYKMPILICFTKLYDQVSEAVALVHEDPLKEISMIVNETTMGLAFQQFQFLYKIGKDNVKPKKKQKNLLKQHEIKFVEYAFNVSNVVSKLSKIKNMAIQLTKNPHTLALNFQYLLSEVEKYKKQLQLALAQNNFQYKGLTVFQNYYISFLCNTFNKIINQLTTTCSSIHIDFTEFSIQQKQIPNSANDLQDSSILIEESDISINADSQNKSINFYTLDAQRNQIDESQCNLIDSLKKDDINNNNSKQFSQLNKQDLKNFINSHHKSQKFDFQIKQRKFEIKLPMCCRQYFTLNEAITQKKNCSYLNFKFQDIYCSLKRKKLKEQICSLLNSNGGIILLGAQSNQFNDIFVINGVQLTQQDKQNIYKYLRHISQQIQPQIVSNKLYQINFIPIKCQIKPCSNNQNFLKEQKLENMTQYLAGMNAIRIKVKRGATQQVYSYRHQNQDYFCVRIQENIIYLEGRKLLNFIKDKINEPILIFQQIHEGICKQPYKGIPLYEKIKKQIQTPIIQKRQINSKKPDFIYFKKLNHYPQNLGYQINYKKQPTNRIKTVFGLAYDFIIYGVDENQLKNIYYHQSLADHIFTQSFAHKVTYLRNIDPPRLKNTKGILKQLYKYLNIGQKYEIVPISKFLHLEKQRQVQEIQKLLQKYESSVESYDIVKRIIKFNKSYFSGLAYMITRGNGYSCKFLVSDSIQQ